MDLSKYYEEICKEPILSKDDEFDLFMLLNDKGLSKAKRAQIRDQIIRANLRFVFKQAKKYSKNDPDLFEELIAAGNEGLLVGLEKYNPSRNVRFLSYAGWWVSQRILKEMSKMRIVSLPIWKQQLAARIQKFCNAQEVVTVEDLKKAFPDVPEKDLVELYDTQYLTFYIEDMDESDPSFEIDPISSEIETRIDKERLHRVVDSLPSPHKEIILLSFGINDTEEFTHAEISVKLGLTKDQIREYKQEAFGLIEDALGSA